MAYIALTREQRETLRRMAKGGATDGQLLDAIYGMAPAEARDLHAFATLLRGEMGAPADDVHGMVEEWARFGGKADSETTASPFTHYLGRWLRSNMLFSLSDEQFAVVDAHRALVDQRRGSGAQCDRPRMEAAIHEAYRRLGKRAPTIVWAAGIPTALTFLHICRKGARRRPEWIERIEGRYFIEPQGDEGPITAGLRALVFDGLHASGKLKTTLQASTLGSELNEDIKQMLQRFVDLPETTEGIVLSHAVVRSIQGRLSSMAGVRGRDVEPFIVGYYEHPRQRGRVTRNEIPGIFWHSLAGRAMGPECAAALGVIYPLEVQRTHSFAKDLICNAWWTWFGEKLAVCCEAPVVQHFDDLGRMHSEEGPALVFGDGVEKYALQGYEVDRRAVMEPELLTVQEIDDEVNSDLRRILMERFGYGRYLNETGAKVVHMDMVDVVHGDRAFGSIPRALLRDMQNRLWLVGTDGSTRRVYYMRVPDTVTTCAQAHEALAGFSEDDIVASS